MSILAVTGFWPPPKLRILIDESVLASRERVPTSVGRRVGCGGRRVNRGSQRIELAVVSWLAIAREDEEGGMAVAAPLDIGCAVAKYGAGSWEGSGISRISQKEVLRVWSCTKWRIYYGNI